MHLESCLTLVPSEFLSSLQQSSQQGALLWASTRSRLPLSVVSTNHSMALLQLASLGTPPQSLLDDQLRLYHITPDGADPTMDIWTVIKPGHVREKIAMFAAEGQRMGGVSISSSVSGDETPSASEKVSVVEMVAFLEQRANEQQPDSKPKLHLRRSSASITLSRAPPPELRENAEAQGEEPESVKVSDMVAKLESVFLRRRAQGDQSQSSNLRTEDDQSQSSNLRTEDDQSQSSNLRTEDDQSQSSNLTGTVGGVLRVTTERGSRSCPSSSSLVSVSSSSSPLRVSQLEAPPTDREPISCSKTPTAHNLTSLPVQATPPSGKTEEEAESGGLQVQTVSQIEAPPLTQTGGLIPCWAPPRGRLASASEDFLLTRRRLQQLLEPQPYLSVLPHHLLVKILLLLPTQSLAALKCTCHYLAFIIDTYGVRPADSLWVSDPRYRDDPCKRCKKRYGPGDVSLCRWHHKPFCQALPTGPGFWMCCLGARRDAPGCNVGLHDNHWGPASHGVKFKAQSP
ncbi:F-box only protein 34-like [Xyrichtys novacula]|uniref:F-box only protein 34-like n=1 Tax=Xyrichtys novacula TaxID=13765 RepID=A0AAV1GNS8_XYRNO|nr:F-box only protein 34-like [Xyrichtys novacula]